MRAFAWTVTVALVAGLALPLAGAQTVWTHDGELLVGLGPYADMNACRYKANCQDLAGISLIDIDVTPGRAAAGPGPLHFNLYDSGDYLGSRTSDWRLCQYNQYDQLLGCHQTDGFGVFGTLGSTATSVRVLLLQGAERPFTLVLWQ